MTACATRSTRTPCSRDEGSRMTQVNERASGADDSEPLLDVRDLSVSFASEAGVVSAVRSVSYRLRRGEVLGIVGESGSGKSVSSLAVITWVPSGSATMNMVWSSTDHCCMPVIVS